MSHQMSVAIVYEVSGNPLFCDSAESYEDRLTEFASPSEVNQIIELLHSRGIATEVVDGPMGLLERASEIKQRGHRVFNKSIGFKGLERKVHVPAICQLFSIPMIGSSAYAMTLARHKFHTNRILCGLGAPVPEARLWTRSDEPEIDDLHFPVIVKPNQESDAVGIDSGAVLGDKALIVSRARWVVDTFEQPAVIEEYIPGEEWKIAVLGNSGTTRVVGAVGVSRNGIPIENSIQSRTDVIEDRLDYYPAQMSPALTIAKNWAVTIHRMLGLRDYSRIDFRLDEKSNPVCMEVSTHPELMRNSSFTLAALQTFPRPEDVLQAIIDAAEDRFSVN